MAIELKDFLRKQIDVLPEGNSYKPLAKRMHIDVSAYIDAQREATQNSEEPEVLSQETAVSRSPREMVHIGVGRKMQAYFGQFEDEAKLDDILPALFFSSMDPRRESLFSGLNTDERETRKLQTK